MKWLWKALCLYIGSYLKSYLFINKMQFLTTTDTNFDWKVRAKEGFLAVPCSKVLENIRKDAT